MMLIGLMTAVTWTVAADEALSPLSQISGCGTAAV